MKNTRKDVLCEEPACLSNALHSERAEVNLNQDAIWKMRGGRLKGKSKHETLITIGICG